jgi:apolipoprotein N-acyltransferase
MKLQGWRVMGAALLAGALAGLAMPPLYWLPLGVVGIVAFVWLWDTAVTPRAALLRGWAWGTGYFAVGSYWMIEAFFVPPADFAVLGPPAVLGLAATLGLFYPAVAAGVARWAALRWPILQGRYRRLVLLALAWMVAEWLRGHLFTGYPWNPLAHVFAFATPLLQGASVVGVYGLCGFAFLILAAPAAGWRAVIAALAALVLAGMGGLFAMSSSADGPTTAGPLLRIVQPNIAQSEKWLPETRARDLAKLIDLSRRDGFDKVAAVIWPETAVPFIVEPGSLGLPMLAKAAPPGGYLLAGAPRMAARPQDGVWNSLLVITPEGAVVGHYDKVHLVPFGEYIPWHKQITPLAGFLGRGSFEAGDSFTTLRIGALPPLSPIICFEAIFPGAVTGPGERPLWLLNVTNDAWFGTSSGPYQHLVSARLRAIEEGLPMIRAANTGVSAVVDAYGNVLASLDLDREGIIDHALPPARPITPYGRWGDGMLLPVVMLFLVALVARRPRATQRL